MKSDVLSVAQDGDQLFLLFIDYEEEDVGSAIGHVYTLPAARDSGATPEQTLATNDSLRVMTRAGDGSIWVASASGNVATSASVRWPGLRPGADYQSLRASQPWSATSLPPVRSTGIPPNITALWASAADDAHAGTYGGHLYHWDGKSWQQLVEGTGDGSSTIRTLNGRGRGDVYAGGAQDTLLHFDGSRWQPIAIDRSNGDEAVTGIRFLPTGEVLVCASGDDGRLLLASATSASEFGRYPISLVGVAPLDERTIFATGDGVAELIGRDVKMIKSTFMTAAIFPGEHRVFLIEPEQEFPGFVDYDPRQQDVPWGGFDF